jgi:chromosome segregation ATPase
LFLLFQISRRFAPIAAGVVSLAASVDGTTQPAQVAGMARDTANLPASGALSPLPAVSLELRTGSALPTTHEVHDVGFLVGTVPGCDLRLPGANLPSVLCLLSRHAAGATLRKLATVLPITINGRAVATSALADGDSIKIGGAELRVRVSASVASPQRQHENDLGPERLAHPPESESNLPGIEELARSLDVRQKHLDEQARALEQERSEWDRRRSEIEQEAHRQTTAFEELRRKEREVAALRLDLERREQALRQERENSQGSAAARHQDELAAVQRELAELRRQLLADFQQRRDRLAGHRAALRTAARKLQARKRQFESEVRDSAWKQAELQTRLDAAERDREQLAGQCRQLEARLQALESELAAKRAELDEGERRLADERTALEKGQAQHRSDLVRLDRLQAMLDQRENETNEKAKELDRRFAQLRHDAAELEEQAAQMDNWHAKLTADAEALDKGKQEHAAALSQFQQRTAALEGQQAMLATLRTRLERMREDVRREEKQLAEHRVAQAAAEADLQRLLKEAEGLRAELDNEKQLRERQSAQFHERQSLVESAVARLREAQESTARQEAELHGHEAELTARSNELDERAAVLEARAEQLGALQTRMAADREAIVQREIALAKAEQTLADLQEQVRRRSDELAARQKAQGEESQQYEASLAALDVRREELERERQQAEERENALRQALDARAAELDSRTAEVQQLRDELTQREETLLQSVERLKAAGRAIGQGRKELADERSRGDAEKQRTFAELTRAHRDFETARDEVIDLQRQLPDLELQAREAAERLAQAREQLRGHVAEAHAYTRQGRDDLELLRSRVRAEAERVRDQEASLHRDRDEHRLAVAQFRQQLIDWQGQVEDLKRALARGETRLERKRAEVDRQVRAVDETSQRLALQAEELQQQEKAVAEKRGEVERHLEDMRLWYRRKLREMAGIRDEAVNGPEHEAGTATEGEAANRRDILSLTGDVDPPDRHLGDLLQSLRLVDADTLTALLVEARRQRRSLRQLLLAGSHLTLYQVALIEAGNLDALVLGPVRVIDRIRVTPAESIYRVFDPRSNREALLRHLTEEEMHDAVRPDEYRQRFAAAAAVCNEHVAATLEVLEIAGRPAVLQENLTVLPSNDWPPVAGAPGVWFRLVNQAFLGLHAAHQAGLVHGHLDANAIMVTADGVVKLCGFGEPSWLADRATTDTPEGDVAALGRLTAEWLGVPGGKKSRTKPLPAPVQHVLDRLTAADPAQRFASAADVLQALDDAAAEVPANAAAWDRFVRQVSDQASDAAVRLPA